MADDKRRRCARRQSSEVDRLMNIWMAYSERAIIARYGRIVHPASIREKT